MDLFHLQHNEVTIFLFMLLRTGIILFMLPVFSSRIIPVMVKAGLAFIVTAVLFPSESNRVQSLPGTLWEMSSMAAGELVIGMVLGILVQVFFEGVNMMGQLAGVETGFSIANVIDPQSGSQTSVLANTAYLVSLVLFLVLNGHHILLNAIRESFSILQPGSAALSRQVFEEMLKRSGDMFVIAVKIGAPVIAAILFIQVAFGLITRLIPQMNIMIVAFPLQIGVGLLFFGVSLYGMERFMENYVGGLNGMLTSMMKLMKG
jgi:flagellar biosynthetic protein FliR